MPQDERNVQSHLRSAIPAEIEAQKQHVKDAGFTRRRFLQSSGIGAAVLVASAAQPGRLFAAGPADALATAKEAYIWGFPLVYTVRLIQLARDKNVPFNRFLLSTRLSTPEDKVAGPNVDTLYGFAWLDLVKEPQILHVPNANGRYYSIQLVDAYGNTFTYVGRRVTGTKEGKYAIVGPGWKGTVPEGVNKIQAPTNQVLALTRTLVSGDADLPSAQAVQLRYGLLPLSAYPGTPEAPLTPEAALSNIVPILNLADRGATFFDDLAAGLALDAPPSNETALIARFRKVGIGPKLRPSETQDKSVLSSLSEAVPAADSLIKKADFNTKLNGWTVNYKITNFIKDPLLRAKVNFYGPGAHIAQEALYFSAHPEPTEQGKEFFGQLLSGSDKYVLKFNAGELPPVDAFWSLTLYGSNFYLVDNPINRYAIGDRTAGLVYGADGSLEIQIQNQPPAQGNSNWLPAPAGSYQLILRTYQPRPALFDGSYKLPPLKRA